MCATDSAGDAHGPSSGTELVSRLAARIVRYLSEESPPVGHRLTERALAERLQVSRSPVRKALLRLREDGFVERSASGGYLVARSGTAAGSASPGRDTTEDADYLRIAGDRLDGTLPERVTKAYLLRRYALKRSRLDHLLIRISNEGWIEPLPGYGWMFLPVVTSMKAYGDSYRFRLLVEPAGILEPTFRLDRRTMERRRAEQSRLVEDGVASVSPARLFELNARFHETIAESSDNAFLVESLSRINRLRRLIEYRQALVPERAVVRCREHVELADLLLAGRLPEASAFLRAHLSTVGMEKSQ